MRENKYYYCCAIPKAHCIPDGFIKIEVDDKKYMVVEHLGDLEEEISMIEQTDEIVNQINAESELLGIELLDIEPPDAKTGETVSICITSLHPPLNVLL